MAFAYSISCVKSYTAIASFTIKELKANLMEGTSQLADCAKLYLESETTDRTLDWPFCRWTADQQQSLLDYIEKHYNTQLQETNEHFGDTTFEYDGDDGEDEDYDDTFDSVDSVFNELDRCIQEWRKLNDENIIRSGMAFQMHFQNSDKTHEKTMTVADWLDYDNYNGTDAITLYCNYSGCSPCNSIRIQPPRAEPAPEPIIITLPQPDWKLIAQHHEIFIDTLKLEIAELKALLERKDKMIAALTGI